MALAKCQLVVTDENGTVVDGASIEVRRESTGALVQVYSDRAGTVALGNPYTAADGADAGCFIAGGAYKITASKDGFERIWRYVGVGLAQESDNAHGPGLRLAFDSGTSAADPGAGEWRANHATFASITALYIDNIDSGGSAITDWLDALDDGGSSAHRCVLRIENATDPLQWAEFNVTDSVVDSTGYRTLTVTPRAQAGWPFTAGQVTAFTQQRSGAAGTSGTSALTRVRVAATANVAIATGLEAGDSLDGVTLAEGDVVLLTAQTAPEENGVYVASASGAAARHSDFDAYDDLPGTYFSVMEGTASADTLWRCTSNRGGTIDVTSIVISEASFGGASDREVLSAARTYYVRADGNDSNDGLTDSAGGAFLTIAKALDVVEALDWNFFGVTIKIGAGTWTETILVSGLYVGQGPTSLTLEGDTSTPSNVVLSTTSADCIQVREGASVSVKGFKLQTTTSGSGLAAYRNAVIAVTGAIEFGTCASHHFSTQSNGRISIGANYTVSGGAVAHMNANQNSYILGNSITVTLSGTPAFTYFALAQTQAGIERRSNTFSGSATGQRYLATQLGLVDTNGQATTYFPGNSAGSTATGGVYS